MTDDDDNDKTNESVVSPRPGNEVTTSTSNAPDITLCTSNTKRRLEDLFQDVLFYPGPVKKKMNKFPSVVTGSKWKEFNEANQRIKAEIEERKKK